MIVQYRDFRDKLVPINLKAGDVGLTRDEYAPFRLSTILSSSIREATTAPVNHAFYVVEEKKELFIMEAVGRGVIKRHWSEALQRKGDVRICFLERVTPLPPNYNELGLSFEGVKYDFRFTLWDSLKFWGQYKLLNEKLRNNIEWDGKKTEEHKKLVACAEVSAIVHGVPWAYKAAPVHFLMDNVNVNPNANFRIYYNEIEYFKYRSKYALYFGNAQPGAKLPYNYNL